MMQERVRETPHLLAVDARVRVSTVRNPSRADEPPGRLPVYLAHAAMATVILSPVAVRVSRTAVRAPGFAGLSLQ